MSTVANIVRYDRPVLHRLAQHEVDRINAQLAADGVPVTVRIDGPAAEVVLWPAVALTTAQEVHAMHVVMVVTDAPVHWAGIGGAR
jgi:hypothetical protein